MRRTRSAFTLVELLIAMAVGLALVLIALVTVRTTAQTVAQANRLALQNKLMRQGLLEALDELDFWTKYDDPLDATNQGLRTITTMPSLDRNSGVWDDFWGNHISPGDGLTGQPSSTSKLKLGLPFAPLSGIPVPLVNDFAATTDGGRPVGTRVRPVVNGSSSFASMVLAPVTALLDDTSQATGKAYDLDRDRGFDPLRPYQANDPRRWYRGNIYETPHSDKRFGRYGMMMNLWQEPMLGFGSDPREPMSFGRADPWAFGPGYQAITGPYGPYPNGDYARWGMQSRTWTWYSNQIIHLWEALGNYGLAEYLPSGAIINAYGARAFHQMGTPEYPEPYLSGTIDPAGPTVRLTVRDTSKPDDNHMRIDERQDFRFSGYPAYWGYCGTHGRSSVYKSRSGSHISKPGTMLDATWDSTHPLIPASPNTGYDFVSLAGNWDDWWYYGDAHAPNTDIPTARFQTFQRIPWAGPRSQTGDMRPLENRSQMVVPLMPQRPATWPDITLTAQRVVFAGRFTGIVRVRWADPVSGEVAELGVSAISTTLRGARQQRRLSGGWAVFYGFNDPRNDPTLDSP